MMRYMVIALCLATAACATGPNIPIQSQSGKPGFVVEGQVLGIHPTDEQAKAEALKQVGAKCPNGADVTAITTEPQKATFGFFQSSYHATVVCK